MTPRNHHVLLDAPKEDHGHSSLPPHQSAVGILSAAVARLEGPMRQLLDQIGPRFPFVQRAVSTNLWLTRALVMRNLENRGPLLR
jgi:carboxypeptidase PM20D1